MRALGKKNELFLGRGNATPVAANSAKTFQIITRGSLFRQRGGICPVGEQANAKRKPTIIAQTTPIISGGFSDCQKSTRTRWEKCSVLCRENVQ
jgi:hypothetical protein